MHGSRYATLLTHGSLLLLTALLFALLLRLPFWLAFVPCALIHHRIGILLHEYVHGIPFRHYRANLAVLSTWDAMFLMFGMLDVFRGTHLAHHRWLNTPGEPSRLPEEIPRGFWRKVAAFEIVQQVTYLAEACRGRHRDVRRTRVLLGFLLSVAACVGWVQAGRPEMIAALLALTVYNTTIPVTLRGAIEHHSHPGDEGFANEYRVVVPMFNLNKHIHHHEDPRCPWYRLEYRTERPLSTVHYFTHWYRVYVRRDYVLMRPLLLRRRESPEGRVQAVTEADRRPVGAPRGEMKI